MIKVTLGANPPKEEKPFPKLMISEIKVLIYAVRQKEDNIEGWVIEGKEYEPGHYSKNWRVSAFTDYNEPITLQNA